MTTDIVTESERILRRYEALIKFESKFEMPYIPEVVSLIDEIKVLEGSIPEIEQPANPAEVIQSELKRRLKSESFLLEQRLVSTTSDFDTIVSAYGIPRSDIEGLRAWLLENKDGVHEKVEKLFRTRTIDEYELGLPFDIPQTRGHAEGYATVAIEKYHATIGKLLESLTNVGGFLRDIRAVPTTSGRSYFHQLTKVLAVDMSAVCFTREDGTLQLRESELIRICGHEGMGHALNQVVTQNSGLPYVLKKNSVVTRATQESVAQFYEKVLLEDLRRSPETQRRLGIEHIFEGLYAEARAVALLKEYQLKLGQYGIAVLADTSIGQSQDPSTMRRKIELLDEVALDRWFPRSFVEGHRYDFDSEGNLNPRLVKELVYCAQPVQRALAEFQQSGILYEGAGRSLIDTTLLTGFWTPIGFVGNARIKAKLCEQK